MRTFSTIIRTSAVGAATALALGLLMLTVGMSPAQATFPGTNGKIAFIKEAVGMSTINPDGSGLTRLNDPWNLVGTVPLWSPDGTRIAFQGYRDGNIEIFIMNADGSDVRRVTNDPGIDLPGSWSPDGTKIAFVSNRDGNREIYTTNVDGSGVSRLTNNVARDDEPAWSPDGTKIAFMAERDAGGEVYVMNADGSAQTNLTNSRRFNEYFPDWQPIPRCTVTGTQGNDKLRGTAGKDVICGLAGNDSLSGWEGDDVLIGGKGDDAVYGGTDNDTFNGGPGTDTASYLGAATAVEASLTTNFATGQGSDVFVGIEDLTGTAFEDTLEGSNRSNVLEGLGGNDVLRVRDGRDNDTADGGTGSDLCQRDPGDTVRSCP